VTPLRPAFPSDRRVVLHRRSLLRLGCRAGEHGREPTSKPRLRGHLRDPRPGLRLTAQRSLLQRAYHSLALGVIIEAACVEGYGAVLVTARDTVGVCQIGYRVAEVRVGVEQPCRARCRAGSA
jgi:hypothetical protein